MASVRIDEDAPVLIGESSPVHISVLKEYLADFRIKKITIAKDGYELLSATQEKTYQFIVFGDSLAKASVVQTISEIRTEGKNKETPIIFLFDQSLETEERETLIHDAIAEGASTTLGKPIDENALRKAIEKILDKVIVTKEEMQSRSKQSLAATEKAIELANSIRDSGDFEQAEGLYVDAILNVFYGLAEMYLFNEDKANSDNVLREASFIDIQAPEKFLDRAKNFTKHGFVNLKEKKYQLAKFDFEAAIAMNSDTIMERMGLGEALLGSGHKDEALKAFNQSLDFEALIENRNVYKRIGTIAFKIKEYDIAVRAFEIALSFIQSDPEIYYFQSLVYVGQWKFPEALQSVTSALKLQPDFSEAKKAREKIISWQKAAEEKKKAEAVEAT